MGRHFSWLMEGTNCDANVLRETPDPDLDRGGEVQKQRIVIGDKHKDSVRPCILDKIRYWGKCYVACCGTFRWSQVTGGTEAFLHFYRVRINWPITLRKTGGQSIGEPAQLNSFSGPNVPLELNQFLVALICWSLQSSRQLRKPRSLLSYWGPPLISKYLLARRFASWQLACLCMCGDGECGGL